VIRPRAARRITVALLALLVPTLVACTARWETVPPLELKGRPSPVDATRFPTRFPIKHVVFIVKENRTFDQMFGDLEIGNGDPKLCLFGEKVTPNAHALAREFVLLDNFYADGEVSADGHE